MLITAAKETAAKLTWFLVGREISKSTYRSCKKAGEKKSQSIILSSDYHKESSLKLVKKQQQLTASELSQADSSV